MDPEKIHSEELTQGTLRGQPGTPRGQPRKGTPRGQPEKTHFNGQREAGTPSGQPEESTLRGQQYLYGGHEPTMLATPLIQGRCSSESGSEYAGPSIKIYIPKHQNI